MKEHTHTHAFEKHQRADVRTKNSPANKQSSSNTINPYIFVSFFHPNPSKHVTARLVSVMCALVRAGVYLKRVHV